ncbi:MAG TPA: pseudouridine synthase [Devosia sp.]|nr:pseudouridine synthase [Devosia sp.]
MAENNVGAPAAPPRTGSRLAKVIARHGLCSRRQAETWIIAGRIAVNGRTIRTPAFNVTDTDTISVDGAPLAEKRGTRVWLYHKPAGLVVTESDPEGRKTIFQDLELRGLPRVLSVGRLDINTEGLLLLTNDGGLKRVLELPATGWLRRYRVRAHGRIEQAELDKLRRGTSVEGVRYGPIEATLERVQGGNVWLQIALKEGKNREIKNVLSSLGLQVNRLIRTSFGPFQLGDIPVGGLDTVKACVLQDQLGKKLAKLAGVDFEAEMPEPLAPARSGMRSPNTRFKRGRAPGPDKSEAGAKREESKRTPAPHGRTGDKRFRARRGEEQRGRKSPPPESETENLKRVHFSGGRGVEMFQPRAKRKKHDSRKPGGRSKRDGTASRGRTGDRARPSGRQK